MNRDAAARTNLPYRFSAIRTELNSFPHTGAALGTNHSLIFAIVFLLRIEAAGTAKPLSRKQRVMAFRAQNSAA